MPLYLYEGAYTPDSWKAQVQSQADVGQRIRPLVEGLGGTTVGLYYSFGEYDVIGILDLPDDEAAAAFSMAVTAGGSIKAGKTTKLLAVEQGRDAMKRASQAGAGYRPALPGSAG